MDGYNFTERVRKVLLLARNQAQRRSHERVGVEHIALGLIEDGGGVAVAVLENHAVPLAELTQGIEAQLPAPASASALIDFPYTPPAKEVLKQAMADARDLGHSYVGTEHLLLALLHDKESTTARVFAEHGMTKEKARAESLRLLGPTNPFR